jgi:hypothetical protein
MLDFQLILESSENIRSSGVALYPAGRIHLIRFQTALELFLCLLENS